MKAGREHKVPLPSRAIAIVKEMAKLRLSEFVFPGAKRGKPLSDMALLMMLRDFAPGITTHGFRSSFRDWAAEKTNTPSFVAEAALAHIVADKVEAAYRRTELLDRRRKLMEAWAQPLRFKEAPGGINLDFCGYRCHIYRDRHRFPYTRVQTRRLDIPREYAYEFIDPCGGSPPTNQAGL